MLVNNLIHKPDELTLVKHLQNLCLMEVMTLSRNKEGYVRLKRAMYGVFLLHLPDFNIYEIFMLINGASEGMLELSIYLVLIIRYYDEVMPLTKKELDEINKPIRDDLGIALLLALRSYSQKDDKYKIKSSTELPEIKGQHLTQIIYRAKFMMVAYSK